jgi:hypothetical protein
MRSVLVVVTDVDGQDTLEMVAADDEQVVEALAPNGAYPSLGERVGHRGSYRRADDLGPDRTPDVVKGAAELGVSISDQVAGYHCPVLHRCDDVAGLLGYPLPCRVSGDTGQPHPTGTDLDEEQDVQTTQQHGVDAEEVTSDDASRLGPDEGSPRRDRAPWCRVDAMGSQDTADRAGRDPTAEKRQLALDPLVAPSRVVVGQTNDDCLDVVGHRWPTLRGCRVGPAAADHPSVPTQQCVGRDHEDRPALTRDDPAEQRQPGPVFRLEARPGMLAAENLELVA